MDCYRSLWNLSTSKPTAARSSFSLLLAPPNIGSGRRASNLETLITLKGPLNPVPCECHVNHTENVMAPQALMKPTTTFPLERYDRHCEAEVRINVGLAYRG